MTIEVLDWRYEKSSGASLKQGVRGGRAPKNAVRGGNGSYLVADPPKVLAKVREVDTGEVCTVDIYRNFKRQLSQEGMPKLGRGKVAKMMAYYQSLGSFEADDLDWWPDIPDLYGTLN